LKRALDEHLAAREVFEGLVASNTNDSAWRRGLIKAHLGAGETLLELDRSDSAREQLRKATAILVPVGQHGIEDADHAVLSSRAHRLSGLLYQAEARSQQAAREWSAAEGVIAPFARGSTDRTLLAEWAIVLLLLGRDGEAAPVVKELLDMSYREPGFLRLCRSRGLCGAEGSNARQSRSLENGFPPTSRPAA
jgi:hypothetical protein